MSAIALLLFFINLVLNFPSVQTWLTHRLASYYSAKLHAKVQIGKVDFELLKKLVLKNVYIEDQHHDTLLYAKTIKLDVGALDFEKHTLYVSDLILDNARFNAVMYKKDSAINLQFLIDYFASKDTTTHPPGPKWDFKVAALTMNNIFFSYRNEHDTSAYVPEVINFTNMRIHNINGHISDILFQGDTLRATIENLTAKEESGFFLEKFSCYVKLSSKKMELNALKIETPNTDLATDLIFKYSRFNDFNDAVNKLNMSATFKKSTVCFDDIAYFAHGLKGMTNCFTLSGDYNGTVTHLKGRNMYLEWGKISSFEGDATLDGLPDIQKTHINVDIAKLVTSKSDVESLPRLPFSERKNIQLPENIVYLKTVQVKGKFDGYVSNFTATGTFSTAIGNLAASLNLRIDTANNNLTYYKGVLQTEAFNLGTFWQNSNLGPITSSVTIEGKGLSRSNADAKLNGAVTGFDFKGYDYTNIKLGAEIRKGFFSGILDANDPNLQMNFDGNVDIASKVHKYNFEATIQKANLVKTNFIHDTTGQIILSTHVRVALTGNTLDSTDGDVQADSTKLAYHKSNYHLKYLDLKTTHSGETHTINVSSDYADANLTGHFAITHINECVQNLLSSYIPSLFTEEKHKKGKKNNYHNYALNLHFNENTGLTNLFIPGLIIAKGTTLNGTYKESTSDVTLNLNSSLVQWTGKRFKDVRVEGTGDHSKMNLKVSCDTLFMSDSVYAAAFALTSYISRDTTHYTIKWNNDTANYADIPGYIAFPNKTDIYFKLVDPIISLGDSLWQSNSSNTVIIDTSGITAKDFEFYHTQQSIAIEGKVSKHKKDAIVCTFKKLNLEDVKLGGPTKLQGTVDGTASVASLYSAHPFFSGFLNFSNLRLNKQSLGDGSVNCYWDNSAQAIAMNGQLNTGDVKSLYFVGDYYDRDSNNLSMDVTLQSFPVKIFEPYIKDYSSAFEGGLSGNAHISGNLNRPQFSGDIIANISRFKMDYLNANYHSSAIYITISPDTFRIRPSTVLDERRDSAVASGILTHNHFKNFKLNFNIDAKNFMCLNTNESNNSLYYGTGFATGNVQLYGPLDNVHLDASITTEKGTMFNIPLGNASEVDQSDIIRFVSKKDTVHKKKQGGYRVNLNGFQMNLIVHVTNDATAKLIFAEKIGNILQGTGTGTLQMGMSPQNDFWIKGEYRITDGTYDYTFRNVFSKKFALEEGGTIDWSGDPYNADIDINAIYKLRTTLEPLQSLLPATDTNVLKKTFPVYCDMNLSGKLLSPNIKFSIELPTADQGTQDVINGYLASNPNEMYRQVGSLLVIKSFLPIEGGTNGASPNAALFAGISSSELLSDELSNMLSSISNKFNVGINYQAGTTPNNNELQVMFSTQLFNDRVTINSDVGTVNNIQNQYENTNNIVGEVTVEYKLSKDGKLKVKGFNVANDNTTPTLIYSPYTQGIGLSYRESFNNFGDLWDKLKNKFKHNSKKEQNSSGSK